jgi:hypothetical protein
MHAYLSLPRMALAHTNSHTHTCAEKIQLPAETVQQAIEGVMYLYTECSKLQVSRSHSHRQYTAQA